MQNQDKVSIDKQAQDWLVKLETGGLAVGDEDRFVEWLEQDEAHGEAFARAEESWQLMAKIDADSINESNDVESNVTPITCTNIAVNKSNPRWFKRFMPIAATVLLSMLTLFYGPELYLISTSDEYTLTGQRLQQTLSDGSVITLNTNSSITLDFTENQRLVKLKGGEIFVDVAPDKSRPFIVEAGDMQVTALGTAFIVKHTGVQPSVVVTEHSVKVENITDANKQVLLDEGQKAVLMTKRGQFAIAENINTNQASAWLNGKYVFDNSRLRAVIDEIARYHQGKIIIRGKKLENMTVSGVLNLDEPQEAIEILASMLSLKVATVTPYLVIIEQG